jgi:hypothetical protein
MSGSSAMIIGAIAKEGFKDACQFLAYAPKNEELNENSWTAIGEWALNNPDGKVKDLASQIAKLCNSEPNDQSLVAWEAAVMVLYNTVIEPEEKFDLDGWLKSVKPLEIAQGE